MQVTELKDLGLKMTELNQGKYLVDGEVLILNSKTKVPFKEEIRIITESRVISHYVNGDGEVATKDYNNFVESFLKHGDDLTLEMEFELNKFRRDNQPVYKTIQTISEPILVTSVKETVVDTGNPYIISYFSLGKESELFTYNRPKLWFDTTLNVLNSLGVSFKSDANYVETKTSKIWSCSSNRRVSSIVAFGKYIYSHEGDITPLNGRLEGMVEKYEEDVKYLTDLLTTDYNICFGRFDKESFNLADVVNKLDTCLRYLRNMDVKNSSKHTASSVITQLLEVKKLIEIAHK